MSLFNRTLRPPPTASDEAIARSLAALRSEVRHDPLFQRRLRSDVVNRFVAAREGIGSSGRTGIGRGRMGQLGRACLYASCTFALSAASVLAASQEALPGEFLYPLKQRIEQLPRWRRASSGSSNGSSHWARRRTTPAWCESSATWSCSRA